MVLVPVNEYYSNVKEKSIIKYKTYTQKYLSQKLCKSIGKTQSPHHGIFLF